MNERPHVVTDLLTQIGQGDGRAADQLLPLVYDELRRLAQHYLQMERPDHTLQATALVHEVYLKLVPQANAHYNDRLHFFRIAALAMRRILKDRARRGNKPSLLSDTATIEAEPQVDHSMLDEALTRLVIFEPQGAEIVQLRYYTGLKMQEIADLLGIPKRTVERRWKDARAWLKRELENDA